MSVTTTCVKKAAIREPGHPVGQPAPCFYHCDCGQKVPAFQLTPQRCDCGRVYDSQGWITEGADPEHDLLRKRHFERLNGYRSSAEYATLVGRSPAGLPSMLGDRWEIDRDIYDELLNILPPLGWTGDVFYMCEFTFEDITARYTREGDRYYCEFARFPRNARRPSVVTT